jgi:hypothetical protein
MSWPQGRPVASSATGAASATWGAAANGRNRATPASPRELTAAKVKIYRDVAAFDAGDLLQAHCGPPQSSLLADTTTNLRRAATNSPLCRSKIRF